MSETGIVYTFTTTKLKPLVIQPEGKNLIQALYNAALGERESSIYFQMLINRTSMPVPQQPNVRGITSGGFGV